MIFALVDVILAIIFRKIGNVMRDSWAMDDSFFGIVGWGIFSVTRLIYFAFLLLVITRLVLFVAAPVYMVYRG